MMMAYDLNWSPTYHTRHFTKLTRVGDEVFVEFFYNHFGELSASHVLCIIKHIRPSLLQNDTAIVTFRKKTTESNNVVQDFEISCRYGGFYTSASEMNFVCYWTSVDVDITLHPVANLSIEKNINDRPLRKHHMSPADQRSKMEAYADPEVAAMAEFSNEGIKTRNRFHRRNNFTKRQRKARKAAALAEEIK